MPPPILPLKGEACDAFVSALHFFVALEVADVVTVTGHLHGMDGDLGAEPGDVTAGGIGAAALTNAFADELSILRGVVIERWTGPMRSWSGRFLRHLGDEVFIVDSDDAALEEALVGRLVVAHDAGRAFLLGITDEVGETEVEDVVTCYDEVAIGGSIALGIDMLNG